jgi:outer membrane biosynthesis protein TonB
MQGSQKDAYATLKKKCNLVAVQSNQSCAHSVVSACMQQLRNRNPPQLAQQTGAAGEVLLTISTSNLS